MDHIKLLNNVLDLLTEEQIALVFSDAIKQQNSKSWPDHLDPEDTIQLSILKLDPIVELSRCPYLLKEEYVILCSAWLREKLERFSGRNLSPFSCHAAQGIKDYMQYLPVTEIAELRESLSCFMAKTQFFCSWEETYHNANEREKKEQRRAIKFFNFIVKNGNYF